MTNTSDPATPAEFAQYVAGFALDGSDHNGWEDAMRGLIVKAREVLASTLPPLHVRVVTYDEGMQLVADLPDWPYPIPRVGDSVFHPPFRPGDFEGIAGHVKTVTWRTHDRPTEPGTKAFVQTAHPYVEIVI